MKDEKFLNQKAKDMSVRELISVIAMKSREKKKKNSTGTVGKPKRDISDKEMVKHLVDIVRKKERKIVELMKRVPFEKLSNKEQRRVIMADMFY